MTKEEFLRRCEIVYDKGFFKDRKLSVLLCSWIDFVMRFEHTFFGNGQGQGEHVWDFLNAERERLGSPYPHTLAGDKDGYSLVEMAAVLDHPCQKCAEDPNTWHTRYGFCDHRKQADDSKKKGRKKG